jgi:hypothetical protein
MLDAGWVEVVGNLLSALGQKAWKSADSEFPSLNS